MINHHTETEGPTKIDAADKPGVSVTWKWLAVISTTALIALVGFFGTSLETRVSAIEQRQMVSPNKEDIRDLRAAIDNLSARIDNLNDGHTVYRSPRQQGQP